MFRKYLIEFTSNLFGVTLFSFFIGVPLLLYFLLINYLEIGIIALIFYIFVISYHSFKNLVKETEYTFLKKMENEKLKYDTLHKQFSEQIKDLRERESLWKKMLKEKTSGFPSLYEKINYYEELKDDNLSNFLRHKPHPAISASEILKSETKRRREAELKLRKNQSLIEYYEVIAPFLLEYKQEVYEEVDEKTVYQRYSNDEIQDPVTNFLTKEEFRKLSTTERNQRALERFWSRPMPKWLLGKIYERYVGYLYERMGYRVSYVGIFKGYEDLGRDLICTKGSEEIVIQCKNWSTFKTIYEKHIFQFFGTVFQYRDSKSNMNIKAIFYTTTELSELAKRFAKELNIEIKENFKMDKNYPSIKCNISKSNGERIYHLPFDLQYDKTHIDVSQGEKYCFTVKEAEELGFRRAFKWVPGKAD